MNNDIEIIVQMTPNPNALKFATNKNVINSNKASYSSKYECNNPLSMELMSIDGVKQILFYENIITITKLPYIDWDEIEDKIMDTIKIQMPEHDPNILEVLSNKEKNKNNKIKEKNISQMDTRVIELNAIFDSLIRPGLQRDGGDIDIIDLNEDILTVSYQGACHSCPSAGLGTLQYIQSVVGEYDPELIVELDNEDEEYDYW